MKKKNQLSDTNDKVWPLLTYFWLSFLLLFSVFVVCLNYLFRHLLPYFMFGAHEWFRMQTGFMKNLYDEWIVYTYHQVRDFYALNETFIMLALIVFIIYYCVILIYHLVKFFKHETQLCLEEFNAEDLKKAPAEYHKEVHLLAKRFGLHFEPQVYIYDVPEPNIFLFGRVHPESTLIITTGLRKLLNKSEMEFVLAQKIDEALNTEHVRSLLNALSILENKLEDMLLTGFKLFFKLFSSWVAVICILSLYGYLIFSWWMMIDSASMINETTGFIAKHSWLSWFAIEAALILSLLGLSIYVIKLITRVMHVIYRVAFWCSRVLYHRHMSKEVLAADLEAYKFVGKKVDPAKIFGKIVKYYEDNQYLQEPLPLDHLTFIDPDLAMNAAISGDHPKISRRLENLQCIK